MRVVAKLSSYWPWLALLAAAVAYYPRFLHGNAMGFYPQAAHCLITGGALQSCNSFFTYPPFFAFVMLPFDPMPMWLRNLVWYGVTLGASIGSFKLAEGISASAVAKPLNRSEIAWMRLLTLALSLKGFLSVFENQAYDALVVFLVLFGLAALVVNRNILCGVGLAFAAALKATPIIFLPYLLWKRHFAAAAIFIIAFLIMSYIPDVFFTPIGAAHGYFNTWLREVAGASAGIDPTSAKHAFWYATIGNHSLRGLVSLNIDEIAHPLLHRIALYVVDGTFTILVSSLLFLSPRRRDSIAIDGSLLLVSMLMLSPMSSRSHYVALLLPYMTLVTMAFRDNRTLNIGCAVLAVSYILVTLTSNDLVGQQITELAYRQSHLVLGTLVLLIYFTVLIVIRHSLALRKEPSAVDRPIAT